MAKTYRAEYVFTVKEYADGTPWIALEQLSENSVPLPDEAFLGFDLPKGTSYEKAKEIARYMRKNLDKLTMTTF